MSEYIEIVHVDSYALDSLESMGGRNAAVARRIKSLVDEGGVHFHLGSLRRGYPDVPKDTQIIVGGGVWNICVKERAGNLRVAGYSDVRVDRSISFDIR